MKNLIGKKCIFRGDRSGVFFGTLLEKDGKDVLVGNCRRIWRWAGANSISDIAFKGVNNVNDSNNKFTISVETLLLTDVIEIITCTDTAIANIESVKVWSY